MNIQLIASKSFFKFLLTITPEGKVTVGPYLPYQSHRKINDIFSRSDELKLVCYINRNCNNKNIRELIIQYYNEKQWSIEEVCQERPLQQYQHAV